MQKMGFKSIIKPLTKIFLFADWQLFYSLEQVFNLSFQNWPRKVFKIGYFRSLQSAADEVSIELQESPEGVSVWQTMRFTTEWTERSVVPDIWVSDL